MLSQPSSDNPSFFSTRWQLWHVSADGSRREVDVPPAGYEATNFGADTTNPEIGKWYAYSMLSHLLTSQHHVYAIRTADGRYAKLEILAYYCREVGSACYTIRYKTTRPRPVSSGARE